MSRTSAARFGDDLQAMGFRPLPDVDDDGRLRGVRLWRPRPGLLEYIALRPSGLAHAGRVVAAFDYRRPFQHGPVIEARSGHAVNALNWLLSEMDLESTQRIPVWDVQSTQPIPVVVAPEIEEARHAARSRRLPPWEDRNRLLSGTGRHALNGHSWPRADHDIEHDIDHGAEVATRES